MKEGKVRSNLKHHTCNTRPNSNPPPTGKKPPPPPNPPKPSPVTDDKRQWLMLYTIVIKQLVTVDSTCGSKVRTACYYADKGVAEANKRFNK